MLYPNLILPNKFRSIHDINCANPIEINWSKNLFIDYKTLSSHYEIVGHKVLEKVIDSGHDNIKSDTWSIVGIFLMRQSLELGLKALICNSKISKQNIQNIFKTSKHNLPKLWEEYLNNNETYLNQSETIWLNSYLISLEEVDKKSDMFRFPFDLNFIKKYNYRFINILETAKNLIHSIELIKKCLNKDNGDYQYKNELTNPTFFVYAYHGIGNWHIWHELHSDGFYVKLKGYTQVANFLHSEITDTNANEYFFPLLFILRHSIELILKRLMHSEIIPAETQGKFLSKRKSHLIKKDLWNNIKPIIIEHSNFNENCDQLNIVENCLFELDKLDKNGDLFRYPTDYSLAYRLHGKKFDINSMFEALMACINFLDNCDTVFEEIVEINHELQLYFSE